MDISVIIPSYKPQGYIWKCLESLHKQTIAKERFEIVFVLNGCNEPWASDLQKWFDRHIELRVNFIQTDTPGVSNARNIALAEAKGEYITFIDDDDYISDTFLEDMFRVSNEKSVVLTDSLAFIDGVEEYIESYKPHQTYIKCSYNNEQKLFHARSIFNGPWMKLIPINFIQGARFDTSLTNGEDSLFMFVISKHIKSLVYAAPSAIYYRRYRMLSATTSRRPILYWAKNALSLIFKYLFIWIQHPFAYNFLFATTRILANFKFIYKYLNCKIIK